jgi:branched-chain amino acid transport system substrate-binding protein
MRRRFATLTWAAVFALAGLAAASATELKVGVLVPTSGSEATTGTDMANAVNLAAAELNAHSGVLGMTIKTIIGDDGCDPRQAVSAANKLVSQGVAAVVGGYCSGSTLPTLKIFGGAGLPFVIAAANSTRLIGANPGNAVMINSTGSDQAKTAAAFLSEKAAKSLAIIDEGDAYSSDLAKLTRDLWRKNGGKVLAFETVNKGEQDYSAVATRIKAATPDAVFWTAYYADGALLVKQLRQAGYGGLIAVGDASNTLKFFEIAGRAAEGVYCFSNPTVDYLPNAKGFAESYRSKYRQEPGPYSALAYDALKLLADAIRRAGSTDGGSVIRALRQTGNFQGIAGPISFTPQNTLARSNFIVLFSAAGAWTVYRKAG